MIEVKPFEPIASLESVEDSKLLLCALEQLLRVGMANTLARAIVEWTELDGAEPPTVRGECIVEASVFALIAKAFNHKNVHETVAYVRKVAASTELMPDDFTIVPHIHSSPANPPHLAAQHGRAHELVLIATKKGRSDRTARLLEHNIL